MSSVSLEPRQHQRIAAGVCFARSGNYPSPRRVQGPIEDRMESKRDNWLTAQLRPRS